MGKYLSILAVVLMVSVGAYAADESWSSYVGGDFHDDGNWGLGSAPVNDADTATFSLAGFAYTVTFAAGEKNATLTVGSTNVVTFDLNSNTYELTGDVTVGVGADGAELKVTDGTLTCDNLKVNYQNDGGTLTIESGGAVTCNTASVTNWRNAVGTLNVGVVGTGTLHVDTGLCAIRGDSRVGAYSTNGYLNVGAGGTVTCDERTQVQDGAVLTLTSGSKMYITPGSYSSGHIINGDLSIWGWGGDGEGPTGILKGSGTLKVNGAGSFTVWNGGIISPGTSIGTITIENGDLVCDTIQDGWEFYDGTLELEFNDTSCDLIELTTAGRSIDLAAATLDFEGSGLTGSETGQYDFLTAETILGFDTVAANDIDAVMLGLGFAAGNWDLFVDGIAGSGQQLRLTYSGSGGPLAGDTDVDGDVDDLDLGALLNGWGMANATWANGDFDADQDVDDLDLGALLNNWGIGVPIEAVPEPATMALLSLGALALIRRNRK